MEQTKKDDKKGLGTGATVGIVVGAVVVGWLLFMSSNGSKSPAALADYGKKKA